MSHDDLRALFLNCTPKKSPERSHTQGLIDLSSRIMEKQGVQVEHLRPIDHAIATAVWPDMTAHEATAPLAGSAAAVVRRSRTRARSPRETRTGPRALGRCRGHVGRGRPQHVEAPVGGDAVQPGADGRPPFEPGRPMPTATPLAEPPRRPAPIRACESSAPASRSGTARSARRTRHAHPPAPAGAVRPTRAPLSSSSHSVSDTGGRRNWSPPARPVSDGRRVHLCARPHQQS